MGDRNFLVLLSDLQRNDDVRNQFDNVNERPTLLKTYNLTDKEYESALNYEDNKDELRNIMRGYADASLDNLLHSEHDLPLYSDPNSIRTEYTDIFRFLFDTSHNDAYRNKFKEQYFIFPFDDYKWTTADNTNEQINRIAGTLHEASNGKTELDILKEEMINELERMEANMG